MKPQGQGMPVPEGPLSPYVALDLADEKGLLCGKILGDLGAEVIKVEKPGGDPARHIGPFYHDIPDPEKSLFWFALNTSKKGITLDLKSQEGQEAFKNLVRRADFVIESFSPGYMDSLGLGYSVLSQINPGIILTSITPYGQEGPYRDFQATDLTLMAMGGMMYLAGDPDRPPVRISVPQAYLQAGAHAAVGTLIAHWYRQRSGLGQLVDVSIQECVARVVAIQLAYWEYSRLPTARMGPLRHRGRLIRRQVWPCQDGTVGFMLVTGRFSRGIKPLVEWMAGEGMAGPLAEVDWAKVDMAEVTPEANEEWEQLFGAFFLKHSKAELYREAIKRHIFLLPDSTPAELEQDPQLASRGFWVKVEHPELGATITYPGAPFKMSRTPWRISRRAPLIGEHNKEILSAEILTAHERAKTPPAQAIPGSQALDGVTVVDFSWAHTGSLITKYLGDFGATVIKVESHTNPDMLRISDPFKDGIAGVNRAGIFVASNSSKYSFSLNLNHPQGQVVARRLVAKADVVVENYAVGQMQKWGLAYEDLTKIRPDIIMLSTTTQGQTGPHAFHTGWGWNINALAGFNYFTGWPDREGVPPTEAYTDYVAPWLGVVAILAALDYRRRTAQGQYIDLSQLEAGLTFLAPALLNYTANGHDQGRQANHSPSAAPHGVYRCRGDDRWCAIAVCSQGEWHALGGALRLPWASDHRFATLEGRKENEEELDRLVQAWTVERTAEEAMAQLQKARVAAGIVQTPADLLERDPQLKFRQAFPQLQHSEMGLVCHRSPPFRLSRTPAQLRPAPCLGEHTELVCQQLLGIPDEEFTELLAVGIFN